MFAKTLTLLMLVVFLLSFASDHPVWGKNQNNSYENHRFYFAITYNPHNVLCAFADSPSGEGVALCLPYEQIVVYGSPANDFEPSTWLRDRGMSEQEMDEEEASLFFLNEVKDCREVPVDG